MVLHVKSKAHMTSKQLRNNFLRLLKTAFSNLKHLRINLFKAIQSKILKPKVIYKCLMPYILPETSPLISEKKRKQFLDHSKIILYRSLKRVFFLWHWPNDTLCRPKIWLHFQFQRKFIKLLLTCKYIQYFVQWPKIIL